MSISETDSLGRMGNFLKPYALKLTQNDQDANDLIQDTLLKALTNQDKFKEGTNLKAWLYTIMKNTFITKKQKVVQRSTFLDSTENLHFLNSQEHTADNQAYSDFALADIHKALDHLEESYRKPFVMHYRGFKYTEIATRLNLPLGTVKNRIFIARQFLKDRLKAYAPKHLSGSELG
ncbi:MAG: RNA polymerase sigma factor [Microscillaceae bacterium]